MARLLSKIPAGKIKPLRVSQREKLSQQQYEKRKAKTAANVAQYEKEKAARATTGSRYGYDTMGGSARTVNINPRARTYREFIEIADNVVEAFTLAADKSKPQSPNPTKLPLSRERNIGKHDDWKDKPSTEWGERTPAAKKLASRASAVVGTQRRQDKETGVTNEAVSASDRKLAASGILSKRADDLQREIDAVKSGKKPAAPNRSARRITKQDYQVKEETEVADKPATKEEKRKIMLMQKLARLKAAAKAPAIVSDVATKEEYELDEAKEPKPPQQVLDKISRAYGRKHRGVNVDASHSKKSGNIRVNQLWVPPDKQGKGIGTRVMKGLSKYADKTGKKITLNQDPDPGKKEKLAGFYKSHGFQANKGKSKDFSTTDTHIRHPKP